MPTTSVLALRGATTLDRDEKEHLLERVRELLTEMLEANGIDHEHLISILFTATPDVHSAFPALAARQLGMGDVPLICAQELDIVGAKPQCIRVLMQFNSERARADLHHVYLQDARDLRDDLPT
ncbi:chorismate mutase [Dermatobacter hominis]|uniref:chorismate mutase n=1 Tax=Dermatobacter hominis TaxID=2884263 RepID=UPI001D100498|nr:chorismate mutase [Dermatobacter hominis]UDY36259.1 chorismate mutase [Dermatobacter hominis]